MINNPTPAILASSSQNILEVLSSQGNSTTFFSENPIQNATEFLFQNIDSLDVISSTYKLIFSGRGAVPEDIVARIHLVEMIESIQESPISGGKYIVIERGFNGYEVYTYERMNNLPHTDLGKRKAHELCYRVKHSYTISDNAIAISKGISEKATNARIIAIMVDGVNALH